MQAQKSTTRNFYTFYYPTAYKLQRAFIPFDTSSIPDNAIITSAKLKVYVESKQNLDNDTEDFVTVVNATQASTSELVTGDYDALGTTELIDANERKDITNVSTSSYLTFNLNTKGKTFIDKTGYTKLSLREGHDILNTAFTGNASEYNYLHIRSSEYSGTSFDPILEISYVTTLPEPSKIQDFEYAYDNNGNITTINDYSLQSSSNIPLAISYTYDDLNRMLSATATNLAGSQNIYTSTYTYDSLGNITSSPLGTYSYAGTNYSNPHAVTSIGPISFTYDNNGNLTNDEVWTHTYNYDNRLTQSTDGTNTTTYTYDPNGQRIKQNNGTTTTIYPTKYYNKEGSTDVKHIYAGDMLIATVRGTGTSAVVSYIHTDHLGSTDKVTNTNAELTEVSDYYPYGNPR
ncbi:MAG: hypothetical protein AAB873_01575, partial [Patescibacteria group bacterium]